MTSRQLPPRSIKSEPQTRPPSSQQASGSGTQKLELPCQNPTHRPNSTPIKDQQTQKKPRPLRSSFRKGAPAVQRASEVPGQPKTESKPERPKAILPKYAVLKKDESLQEKSNQLAGMVTLLEDEYKRIQEFVKDKVNKEVKVAGLLENVPHNRYQDIGGLDQCIIPNNNYPQFPMMTTMSS